MEKLSNNNNSSKLFSQERFLVTGVTGQLGFNILKELYKRGAIYVLGVGSDNMDITLRDQVFKVVLDFKPTHIIHCAAYTNVDGAEVNQELCYAVNVEGTKNIMDAAKTFGAKLTYISTDYVFDGKKDGFYQITDATCPLNYYGKTKCIGEEIVRLYSNHFIVRISWLFGRQRKNFLKTMLSLSQTKKELKVVCDQYGSPSYTVDIAKVIIDLQNTTHYGTYHARNEGLCSWYEFAVNILSQAGIYTPIYPISSSQYSARAIRPKHTPLSIASLNQIGISPLPNWKIGICSALEELQANNDPCLKRVKK